MQQHHFKLARVVSLCKWIACMHLNLIERHIFRRALLATTIASLGLIGVMWVIKAVQTVDVIMNQGQGIATYLKMTTLGVPSLAAAIAPLALLIGLIRTVNALNEDSELVVLHASGASRKAILKPFILLSILIMIIVYLLHLWAAPLSMRTLRTEITKARADLVSVIIKDGAFTKAGQNLTFHIAGRAPGGKLKGVLILDSRDESETFTYLAREGSVAKSGNNSFLVLNDGQIHKSSKNSSDLSIIRFNSYAFNLSSISGNSSRSGYSQSEIPTAQLFFPDKNESLYKHAPNRYVAELHSRLTGGLYPIMIGLLLVAYVGFPNSHRQGQGLIIATACGVILGLRALTIHAEGAIRSNTDMVAVVWLVPILAILFSLFVLATDRTAYSARILARFEETVSKSATALRQLINLPKSRQIEGGSLS